MRRAASLIAALFLLIGVDAAKADHAALPQDVTPVMATWLWGYHVIPGSITKDGAPYMYSYPHTDPARIVAPRWTEVAATHIQPGAKAPAVLFLHGCSGIIRGGTGYRILLMTEGYAVFEPDAYARPGHNCDNSSIATRLEDATHALAQIRALPWIDQDRIILMGLSEGGRTVRDWKEPGFAAHVIISAPADARASNSIPLLAISGDQDDYANPQSYGTNGHAGASKSILIAGEGHDILGLPETKKAIRDFLRECCR